jgi:hypothetical protein
MAMTAATASMCVFPPDTAKKDEIASVMTLICGDCREYSEKWWSFQTATPVKMMTETVTGFSNGKDDAVLNAA